MQITEYPLSVAMQNWLHYPRSLRTSSPLPTHTSPTRKKRKYSRLVRR